MGKIVTAAEKELETPKNFKGSVEYSNEGQTVLTITWDKVTGADGYKVYYRSNVPGEDTWEEWNLSSKTKDTTAQGWIIDGVFQMRVKAYKGSSNSKYTDVITVEGGTGIKESPAIKLSASKKTIYVGKSSTLTLKNASGTTKWVSSDKKVATVNSAGKVTAHKKGSCIITAVNNGKKYTCKITVKNITSTELYRNILNDNIHKYKTFALLDIDQNGTKELLLCDTSSAAYVNSRIYIYTFHNGKLNSGIATGYGEMSYYKKSKCLRNEVEGFGSLSADGTPSKWVEYYKIKNGKVISSKSETCSGNQTKINWYVINAENINKYLK